ncbi:unnamed protein product [Trichobilharzia szidati]|nr:unnamed protein product [Trichobilharzia szidati]
MSDLKEDDHRLKARLDVLEEMETAFVAEIQSLDELIAIFQRECPGEFRNIDDRQSEKLSEMNRLAEKLNALENLETDLLKRLCARENKVDEICMDSNNRALKAVKLLENHLSRVKKTAQMRTSRLCGWIEGLEEDVFCLQSYKDELEQKLKECQSTLENTQAQCETLQVQLNPTMSLVSEVDKERKLLEQMVVKQREEIRELRRRLDNMPAKLTSLLAAIRVDSCPNKEIMDILDDQIEDIRWENKEIHRKIKDYEELKAKRKCEKSLESPESPKDAEKAEAAIMHYCRSLDLDREKSLLDTDLVQQRIIELGHKQRNLKGELRFLKEENSRLSTQATEVKAQLDALQKK